MCQYSIVIKTSTWKRDYNNLFDYENQSVYRTTHKTAGTCTGFRSSPIVRLYQTGDNVVVRNGDSPPALSESSLVFRPLARVIYSNGTSSENLSLGIYTVKECENDVQGYDSRLYHVVSFLKHAEEHIHMLVHTKGEDRDID